MTDRDLLMHPEHWHERAEKALAMARETREEHDRNRFLRVARSYERLAVRAHDWKAARER